MEYPVWLIPGLSKGFLMALVAVLHVFVAQFAVGGGIYLVFMEKRARAWNSPETLAWLQRHTLFFLLLTMVFGGLSGVGIWFTMSLSNPAATSSLIHIFLWIWAAEWVFFLVEILALLVYHYSYPLVDAGRMSARAHLTVGYIYAVAGFMSLLLINGVICFMLTPGAALDTASLFDAFFNPSALPSLLFRSSLCLIIAGMFGLFTASRIPDEATKRRVIRLSSLWVLAPLIGLLAGAAWYYAVLPPDRQAAILRRSADIHPFVQAFQAALPVIFALGVIAFVLAARLRRPLAVLILCSGLALAGSFEWMREAGRRPWIIPGYMYSSAVLPAEGARAAERGLAETWGWLRLHDADYTADRDHAFARGQLIFAQQCGVCHAVGGPSLNILPRLEKFAPAGILAQITGQGKSITYMPPFFGDRTDKEALAVYLSTISHKTGEAK